MNTLLLQLLNLLHQTVRPSRENCLEQESVKIVPGEIEKNAYAKFWRENKEYFGILWKNAY